MRASLAGFPFHPAPRIRIPRSRRLLSVSQSIVVLCRRPRNEREQVWMINVDATSEGCVNVVCASRVVADGQASCSDGGRVQRLSQHGAQQLLQFRLGRTEYRLTVATSHVRLYCTSRCATVNCSVALTFSPSKAPRCSRSPYSVVSLQRRRVDFRCRNAVVLNLFHCWDPLNATDVVWDPQVKIEKVCAPE